MERFACVCGHRVFFDSSRCVGCGRTLGYAADRPQMRTTLGQPYRTVLGHLRHESGHYFFDRLLRQSPELEGFEAVSVMLNELNRSMGLADASPS